MTITAADENQEKDLQTSSQKVDALRAIEPLRSMNENDLSTNHALH